MRDKRVQPTRLAAWALTALAAAALTVAPAWAQPKELRFGHLHSAESPIHKGVTKAAEEFAKSSGGRYKINVFPSSQLGAAREMVAQVIDGTLDFISEGPGSLSNLNKALSLFEAPFVARDWDHVQKMLASPFGQEQLGKLAAARSQLAVSLQGTRAPLARVLLPVHRVPICLAEFATPLRPRCGAACLVVHAATASLWAPQPSRRLRGIR